MDYKKTAETMAGYIFGLDTDEDICKRTNCTEDCITCLMEWFSKDCKWLSDEFTSVCVNDQSEFCADFVTYVDCGKCKLREC